MTTEQFDIPEGQQGIKDFLDEKLNTHLKPGDAYKPIFQNGRLQKAAQEANVYLSNLGKAL